MLKAKNTRRSSKLKLEALSDVTKVETTRFNAEIPVDLHTRIKRQAMDERRNMTAVMIDALNAYLSKHELTESTREKSSE